MAKIGSDGNGKASSMSVDNFGPTTVAGNVRTGSSAANLPTMPLGKGGGAKKGLREGYLGSGIGPGQYQQVSAGTPGGSTGAGGRNGTPMATSGLLPGMVTKKPITFVDKDMKEGKGGGAKVGLHKGFL